MPAIQLSLRQKRQRTQRGELARQLFRWYDNRFTPCSEFMIVGNSDGTARAPNGVCQLLHLRSCMRDVCQVCRNGMFSAPVVACGVRWLQTPSYAFASAATAIKDLQFPISAEQTLRKFRVCLVVGVRRYTRGRNV